MKLLKQKDRQCMLYSFAMCLNVSPEELMHEVGHNGLTYGYHYREFYPSCIKRGMFPSFLEYYPMISTLPDRCIWDTKKCLAEIEFLIKEKNCVFFTATHAVASDSKIIFDPNGLIYNLDLEKYLAVVVLQEINYK